jgi:hypothetical protein
MAAISDPHVSVYAINLAAQQQLVRNNCPLIFGNNLLHQGWFLCRKQAESPATC